MGRAAARRRAPLPVADALPRMAALLFFTGGVIGLVLWTVADHPAKQPGVWLAISATATVSGVVVALLDKRIPTFTFDVLNVVGSLLITGSVWAAGGGTGAVGLMIIFAMVPSYTFFFFPLRRAVTYALFAMLLSTLCWMPLARVPWEAVFAINAINATSATTIGFLVRLASVSERDGLTGLLNRRGLDRLAQVVAAQCERAGVPLSVAYFDVDHFKHLNDSQGHSAGDTVLREIAASWTEALPADVLLARNGGDEFVALMPGVPAGDAVDLLDRARRAVPAGVTVSIGYTESEPGDTTSLLFRRADAALYQAKRSGRNVVWPQPGAARALARLKQALQVGGIVAAIQPIVDLRTGERVGGEALARWHDGERDVSPAEFIPLAEETGLIVDIGQQIMFQACAAAVASPTTLPRVGVNASAIELSAPDYVETVERILAETGLPPERLVVEVTESGVLAGAHVVGTLRRLREAGVKIAMDDFGTGYSSLHRLVELPLDMLKIDKSFVARLSAERPDPIVTSIVALADALSLTTVAEGVETAEQAEHLRRVGCSLGQGWLLGEPTRVPLPRPSGKPRRGGAGPTEPGSAPEPRFSPSEQRVELFPAPG